MSDKSPVSSGISGLDTILNNLTKGDNVVWLSPSIKDYSRFVAPFVKQAVQDKRKIVYFRFASHENLIPEECRSYVDEHKLEAGVGFESFTKEVYSEVERHGKSVFYVFDSLSDLLYEWVTDAAISNFFMVICPFLYKLDTVAYFAILKHYHSFETISKIRKTAQVLIEVFNREGIHYVHPHKVFGKNSPTMFLPHECRDEENFIPIDNSYLATKLSSTLCAVNRSILNRRLDSWDRIFMEAEKFEQGSGNRSDYEIVNRIIKALMGRDEKILSLVKKHFTINDLLEIKNRMIGTGFIGGKAVGMLLARKILYNTNPGKWE
uniref:RAD55 family ATPase n=1 Tax=Flexistipes sinusarabici TaxID=2352 RepID=UPI003C6CD29D